MSDQDTKLCRKCGETYPLDMFYRYSKSPDGRQYHCKSCQDGRTRVISPNRYMPEKVPCVICRCVAKCTLDNPRWFNQYSDTLIRNVALCGSDRCLAELYAILKRMDALETLNTRKVHAV